MSSVCFTNDVLTGLSESKMKVFCTFVLYFAHLALTFLRQVRLRFGMTDKKTRFFLCHALTLHYSASRS